MGIGNRNAYLGDTYDIWGTDDADVVDMAPRPRRKKLKKSIRHARRSRKSSLKRSQKRKAHSSQSRKGKKRPYPHHLKKYFFKKGHR